MIENLKNIHQEVVVMIGHIPWLSIFRPDQKLGGGFKYFLFLPRKLGKMNQF